MGERFHIAPALLALLNPGKDITKPGEEIFVPNLEKDFHPPMAAAVVVSKSNHRSPGLSPGEPSRPNGSAMVRPSI